MEVMEAILARRSIRQYSDRALSAEVIDSVIQAAMAAPSAHNEQPWHFIVITDRQVLDAVPRMHPYAQMLNEAPMALCVCADLNLEAERGSGYWIQDCAAATENILLAATGLGLGTCWLGIHPREERKKALSQLLQLPAHVVPFCLIAVGYAAESKPPLTRCLTERVHRETW